MGSPGYSFSPYYPTYYPSASFTFERARTPKRRPWQLVVGAILSILWGIALLAFSTFQSYAADSVLLLVIVYIPAAALVVAPVFMLMGYTWAYALTLSGLLGSVLTLALTLVSSEAVLLPFFVVLLILAAVVAAPLWVGLWLLLTRRVEEVFERDRKLKVSVYYKKGEEEPPMLDPKEKLPYSVMYVPAFPYYSAYPAYYLPFAHPPSRPYWWDNTSPIPMYDYSFSYRPYGDSSYWTGYGYSQTSLGSAEPTPPR